MAAIGGLLVEPVFQHHEVGSDQNFACPVMILVDIDVRHKVTGAAGGFLRMNFGMIEPGQAGFHNLAVIEKNRDAVVGIDLIGRGRHPVITVFRE